MGKLREQEAELWENKGNRKQSYGKIKGTGSRVIGKQREQEAEL